MKNIFATLIVTTALAGVALAAPPAKTNTKETKPPVAAKHTHKKAPVASKTPEKAPVKKTK